MMCPQCEEKQIDAIMVSESLDPIAYVCQYCGHSWEAKPSYGK